jgi:hypothetical protein
MTVNEWIRFYKTIGFQVLILPVLLTICSSAAMAQFPLKASRRTIKNYFDEHVPYASQREFNTQEGIKALCFTKVKVIGDYTFHFNQTDECDFYIETYDKKEANRVTSYLNKILCPLTSSTWCDEDNLFTVTLMPDIEGTNYIALMYRLQVESKY